MAYTQILLPDNEDFKRGFMAALDFLDGADGFQIFHSDADSVTLTTPQGDNATYVVEGGQVVFDSTGVEL